MSKESEDLLERLTQEVKIARTTQSITLEVVFELFLRIDSRLGKMEGAILTTEEKLLDHVSNIRECTELTRKELLEAAMKSNAVPMKVYLVSTITIAVVLSLIAVGSKLEDRGISVTVPGLFSFSSDPKEGARGIENKSREGKPIETPIIGN